MIQTTIRIPKELHQKLKELAKKKGLTVNALIVQALWKLQEVVSEKNRISQSCNRQHKISVIDDLFSKNPTVDELTELLETELTEKQLQTIKSIAVNNDQSLSI